MFKKKQTSPLKYFILFKSAIYMFLYLDPSLNKGDRAVC